MADDNDYLWDPTAPPDREVERLEALLHPAAHRPVPLRVAPAAPARRGWLLRWPAVAAAVLVVAGGAWLTMHGEPDPWSVRGDKRSAVTLRRGEVLETDARSTAELTVGEIGRARLGPGSRLRLVGDGATEHRLSLERGTMHASIDAPPRYFLVQTASALAVDLGCVYTLTADERGNGTLTVEEGEVELQLGGVRTSVLAGNSAGLREGSGPGLPYPVTASAALRQAVAAYDAAPADDAMLGAVLAAADARSTITLWHLLQRATPAQRAAVYDRLGSIAPPPTTVTRERVLRGESGALQRWRTELEPSWITNPPLWRRAWLAVAR